MKTRNTFLAKVGKIYDVSKKWIIYLDIVLILVLLYFGDFLGPLREILLPAAVVSALAILFETLQGLETRLSSALKYQEFGSLADTVPVLSDIVRANKTKTTIEIIAATGGTTTSTLLPTLLQNCQSDSIEVSLKLINPSSSFIQCFPPHWPQEVQTVIERLKTEYQSDKVRLSIYTYDYTPFLHGVLINKEYLALGFFGWTYLAGVRWLRGAERLHRCFSRAEPSSRYFFELFEDWWEHGPCQLVYASQTTSQGK